MFLYYISWKHQKNSDCFHREFKLQFINKFYVISFQNVEKQEAQLQWTPAI